MAAVDRLTDDLLLEILSHVPAMSLFRFKCVSNHWFGLINHPDHRKRFRQAMAGFFYTSTSNNRLALRFLDILGSRRTPLISPSLAFLPKHKHPDLLDGSNGLLLCRWLDKSITRGYEFIYVVCNPTTEQWAALPGRSIADEVGIVHLGFDAAVSPHFHVFVMLLGNYRYVTGVDVYSSETRRWVHQDRRCQDMRLRVRPSPAVFLHGYLHFCTIGTDWGHRVAVVDTEGEIWINFDRPKYLDDGFIQLSQGRLHYALFATDKNESEADIRLEVYVMNDYDSKEWTMKHSIKGSDIFEGIHVDTIRYFSMVAIHPDCDLIFFTVGPNKSLLCYDFNRRQAKLITDLGRVSLPYVPYVPMYSELESLNM